MDANGTGSLAGTHSFVALPAIALTQAGQLLSDFYLQAAIDRSQETVTGTVRLKLYKGNVTVAGRKSPHSLYSLEHVTFEEDQVYDQRDAAGFIRLNALRLRLLNRQKG